MWGGGCVCVHISFYINDYWTTIIIHYKLLAALPVPDVPLAVQAMFITTTTALIIWTAPPFDPSNRIAFYNLTLVDEQFGLPDVQVMHTEQTYQYMFTGLEEYANYTCDVISVGVFGTFSAPASIIFTTLEAGVC